MSDGVATKSPHGLSLDWVAVIGAVVLVALTMAGILPPISW